MPQSQNAHIPLLLCPITNLAATEYVQALLIVSIYNVKRQLRLFSPQD